jgi:hypothetical protein
MISVMNLDLMLAIRKQRRLTRTSWASSPPLPVVRLVKIGENR